MPFSVMSSTRILTILSLVALCSLSFGLIFGTDTLAHHAFARESQFSLDEPKSINVPHHGRAFHHARASSAPAAGSDVPSSNAAPSQPAASPAVNSQASSAALPSPSPSSSPPAQQSFSSSPSQSPATSASPPTTSASAFSSPTASSSPSPSASPSPSSNIPASSSQPVTSSSVGVGVVSNVANPTTSPVNTPNTPTSGLAGSSRTISGSTLTIDASSTAGAASSGFLHNKAAVGVTFTIVGIVGGLAVIMGVLTFLRRHRRAREAIEDEEFFEKYPNGDGDFGDVPQTSGFGTTSVTEVSTSAARPDAYPDRAIHYGQSNPSTVLNPVDYGIAYPPSASAGGSGNAYGDVGPSQSLPSASHPFANPSHASFTTAAPPPIPRRAPARMQEMVITDSYYGPNTAGVGAGAGYAE